MTQTVRPPTGAHLLLLVGPVRHRRLHLEVQVGPVRDRIPPGPPPNPKRRARFRPRKDRTMAFRLQDNQEVDLSVSAVDAAGNPTSIDGTLQWASSDETVLVVQDNGDQTATAVATGLLGTAQIQVTDAETSGATMSGTLDVEVVTGPAVTIVVSPGEARDKA